MRCVVLISVARFVSAGSLPRPSNSVETSDSEDEAFMASRREYSNQDSDARLHAASYPSRPPSSAHTTDSEFRPRSSMETSDSENRASTSRREYSNQGSDGRLRAASSHSRQSSSGGTGDSEEEAYMASRREYSNQGSDTRLNAASSHSRQSSSGRTGDSEDEAYMASRRKSSSQDSDARFFGASALSRPPSVGDTSDSEDEAVRISRRQYFDELSVARFIADSPFPRSPSSAVSRAFARRDSSGVFRAPLNEGSRGAQRADFDFAGPSFARSPKGASAHLDFDGDHHSSVRVTMDAAHNDFLARLPPLVAPSFAGPVVDPQVTQYLELLPRGVPTDSETGGEGGSKFGRLYTVKETNDHVIIKWFRWYDENFEGSVPEEYKRSPKSWNQHVDSVMTDFYSQSIAHLLSQLYSANVENAQKTLYMQPLLVFATSDNGRVRHYGLMERQLESFHLEPPTDSLKQQFYEFQNFINNHELFIAFRDTQGWHQREANLYLTDAMLEIYDGSGSTLIHDKSEYDLAEIYDILVCKMEEMAHAPMDLSEENTGDFRKIFGKSIEDDVATIAEIRSAKSYFHCVGL